MITNGSWVVGRTENEWSYPGRVICVNDAFVIFEIFDIDGSSYETHRMPQDIRLVTAADFDRFILDATKMMMKTEELIGVMYDVQAAVTK
jgi:hypothetical protein